MSWFLSVNRQTVTHLDKKREPNFISVNAQIWHLKVTSHRSVLKFLFSRHCLGCGQFVRGSSQSTLHKSALSNDSMSLLSFSTSQTQARILHTQTHSCKTTLCTYAVLCFCCLFAQQLLSGFHSSFCRYESVC